MDIISIKFDDGTGEKGTKSLPLYFPGGLDITDIQAGASAFATDLDAVTDALITEISVRVNLSLPGGLKSVRGSNTVREGALLNFLTALPDRSYGVFVPSWKNAGFAGNTPLNTGAYATLIAALVSGLGNAGAEVTPTSDADYDLTSYTGGKRSFRK